jgi:hypothetical protein
MQDMQDFLNTDVDGRYLFAGSRARTRPLSLPASTLAQFQRLTTATRSSIRQLSLTKFL